MPQIFHIKAKICSEATLSGTTANKYWLLACWSCTESHLVCVVLFGFVFISHLPFGLSQHTRLLWGARWVSLPPGLGGAQLQWLCRVARLPAWHMSKATRMQLPAGLYRTTVPNRWVQARSPVYVCVCVCAILNVRRWRSGCAAEFLLKINWKIP